MSTPAPSATSTKTSTEAKKRRPTGVLSQAIGDLPEALDRARTAEKSGDGLRAAAENLAAEIEAAGARLRSLLAFK